MNCGGAGNHVNVTNDSGLRCSETAAREDYSLARSSMEDPNYLLLHIELRY